MAYEEYQDYFRSFDGLVATDLVAEWQTPNDLGRSEHWVTRIVYESHRGKLDPRPIIEFYSVGRFCQFVSAYYVETLLGGYGDRLDLMGYEPHWKIDAGYMDEIRDWAAEVAVPYEG